MLIPTILFLILTGLLVVVFIGGLLHCADDKAELNQLREMDERDYQNLLDRFEDEHSLKINRAAIASPTEEVLKHGGNAGKSQKAVGLLILATLFLASSCAPVFAGEGWAGAHNLAVKPLPIKPSEPHKDTAGTNKNQADRLLSKFAAIESSNRANAIGDGGKARGAHQMHLAAILDCGGTRADWIGLTNRATSDKFAGMYLSRIQSQFAKLKINPTDAQIYMAWNLGFTKAKRLGFDLANAPRITRDAVKKF